MKLPKRPKQPKKSAPLSAWQRYDERMKNWEKRIKELKAAPKKKDQIANKWRGKSSSSM